MRLFAISDDGDFTEYAQQDFKIEHQERILESWLEANPAAILHGEQLLVIGRQVTTNLKTFIDVLALDRYGSSVVVELKRDRTPRHVGSSPRVRILRRGAELQPARRSVA